MITPLRKPERVGIKKGERGRGDRRWGQVKEGGDENEKKRKKNRR